MSWFSGPKDSAPIEPEPTQPALEWQVIDVKDAETYYAAVARFGKGWLIAQNYYAGTTMTWVPDDQSGLGPHDTWPKPVQ
jgi:hypothetical protein